MFKEGSTKAVKARQSKLRKLIIKSPGELFRDGYLTRVERASSGGADNVYVIYQGHKYRVGECHCHKKLARGLESSPMPHGAKPLAKAASHDDMAEDDRTQFEQSVIDSLPKDKRAMTLLGLGTGELFPTLRLCILLANAGKHTVNLHLVDPAYTDVKSMYDMRATLQDFQALLTKCGIKVNKGAKSVNIQTYNSLARIGDELMSQVDAVYAYDIWPPGNIATLLPTIEKARLKDDCALHLRMKPMPTKEQVVSSFTEAFVREHLSFKLSESDIDKRLPLFNVLWGKFVDKLFAVAPKDFPALERVFLEAFSKLPNTSAPQQAFRHVALMAFYSLDAVPTQTEDDYLQATEHSAETIKPVSS